METRSAKRRKLMLLQVNSNEEEYEDEEEEEPKVDRISDLPDHILHCILKLLPIKSAAQTAILSSRWKNVFSNIPDLDFRTLLTSSKCMCKTHQYSIKLIITDLKFIKQVLNLRQKNSSIRTLKLSGSITFTDLHNLFKYVTRHDIQELDLDLKIKDHFNFPRSIINCDSLKILRLRSSFYGFRISPSSVIRCGRFKSLHTLSLSMILFHVEPTSPDLFTDLTFPCLKNLLLDCCYCLKELNIRCRGLENLFIMNCNQLNKLDIVGLKLERLNVDCCFNKSSMNNKVIINAPIIKHVELIYNVIIHTIVMDKSILLESTVINLFLLQFDNNLIEPVKRHNLSNMINAFSRTKSLTLESGSIEILSRNDADNILVNKFESLKKLEIETQYDQFNGYNNYPAIATLFENSPYVETLVITTMNIEKFQRRPLLDLREYTTQVEDKYWGDRVPKMNSFFNHLRMFKFDGFLECDKDISLVMFLIKHGNVLEEVILCLGKGKKRQLASRERIMSMMMSFSWASSKGRIVFE
ncbi:putative F-box/FBD/LRR-repeat protein At4g03220 [Impatiens glandulifera]|uniref:putative F-box/FBD/LRR-repeat protein At4g03220 n=1 Tax=Impatiens glandulifera TaxID=253017 RepID=UPI001FB187C4|nr:putative F-box/FBD/LRR-repeat protein At4g03220 [Impatiens glandulifera]